MKQILSKKLKGLGIKAVSACLLFSFIAAAAMAQEAPPPRRMPRTPVSRETIVEPRDSIPASREVQGTAAIIDGERLRIGQIDLRLFGIAPPQLAASFGPQARAQLDALAAGQTVSCRIRDRDRDGRLLATCLNVGGSDMALELLRRGLAVVLRGSVAGTDLAALYVAAEQAAQNQKIGLWSMVASAAAAIPASALTPPPPKAEAPQATAPDKEEKARAEHAAKAAEAQAKAVAEAQAKIPASAQAQAKVASDILTQQAQAEIVNETWAPAASDVGFFERYQILISGFMMLATVLCISGTMLLQRTRDRRDEIKACAAALRGELMAARGVCYGRAKSITCDADDRTAVWPRIRSTLYQAYVGRLGLLGAELARQVASVYGQTSDYAALYNPVSGTFLEVTKKQALETLVKRIDEILPKLAQVEKSGKILSAPSVMESGSSLTKVFVSGASSLFNALGYLQENLRKLIENSRDGAVPAAEPLPPEPPHVTEYTAIIEADMERFQYIENIETIENSDNVETLPSSKKRKRKDEKGAA